VKGAWRIAAAAESDVAEILDYIAAQDGVTRALAVHARFVRAFERLAAHPGLGKTRAGLTGTKVRWWRVFRWMVLYEGDRRQVTILRVVHGARGGKWYLVDDGPAG
jgi:toxin ParE1/3/4